MARTTGSRVVQILDKHERDLLGAWVDSQLKAPTLRRDLIQEADVREQRGGPAGAPRPDLL
jgi:hypothetical protein